MQPPKNLIDGSGTIFIGKSYRSFGHLVSWHWGIPQEIEAFDWMDFWWNSQPGWPAFSKPMESYLDECASRPILDAILSSKAQFMAYTA